MMSFVTHSLYLLGLSAVHLLNLRRKYTIAFRKPWLGTVVAAHTISHDGGIPPNSWVARTMVGNVQVMMNVEM